MHAAATADLGKTFRAVHVTANCSSMVHSIPLQFVEVLNMFHVLSVKTVINLWFSMLKIEPIGMLIVMTCRVMVVGSMVQVLLLVLLCLIEMVNHLSLKPHELLKAHLVSL